LKTRRAEPGGKSRPHEEWIYGLNPVLEAIRSGRKIKSVVISTSRKEKVPEIEGESAFRGIPVKREDRIFFDSRFPKGHQGIAAVLPPREYADFEDLFDEAFRRNEVPLFLALDCLEDPRNLGAILRVADAAGVHGIILQEHRSVTLGPEAVKASAGASEYIQVALVPNIKHAIRGAKARGILVVGAEAGEGRTLWELDLRGPVLLVVGSEGKGLRRTVREACDALAGIPMKGRVNSLNASVAAGVIIFEILRQRWRIMEHG
jgi:23S rRNA (guanosine2251-2'-O)-methyltransferase